MKKPLLLILLFISSFKINSQVLGEWVWKSGSNTLNYLGNFGTQGIPSPTNKPPGLYEAAEWTDLQGNFWILGEGNLWKYEPSTNLWTWMKGDGTNNQAPIYGVIGVTSVNNTPGSRSMSYTWVDNVGDFWLFGPSTNALWKYQINSNSWTWMKGDSIINNGGNYGTKGIELLSNCPPSSMEIGICWTADNGDLWLMDNNGCLWQYKINTNNWIWIKGDHSVLYPQPVYGLKGIPNINNTPGYTFFDYTRWKDSNGDFWYLNGMFMILWKYNINTNMWVCVTGNIPYSPDHNYGGIICEKNNADSLIPLKHRETRTCWIDECDNLWLMGGAWYGASAAHSLNDLIYYDTHNNDWVWADNDTIANAPSNYGIQGVSSINNVPASRTGSLPFKDLSGNLWLFGGNDDAYQNFYGDLWMYTIDTTCTNCNIITRSSNNKNKKTEIIIFPNPSNGKFTISSKNENITEITIIDIFGKKNIELKVWTNEYIIDMNSYSKGIYNVLIQTAKNIITKRIVLQ